MKHVRTRLRALLAAVEAEAERNSVFAAELSHALGIVDGTESSAPKLKARKAQRRSKGAFNPMDALRDAGENGLRRELASLNIEQLKDIIAENGMDQRKLAMKWKSADRLTDLIVTTAHARIVRGDVFR
ncbi:hypothetical protein BH23GEM9_BH23GEM9_20190 [soil metagenome]